MKGRQLLILVLCASVMSCNQSESSTSDTVEPTADAQTDSGVDAQRHTDTDTLGTPDVRTASPVDATILVADPATGGGSSGVTVTSASSEAVTDATGRATVEVAPGPYNITLTKAGARPHRVFGVAGEQDFEQITYMSPEMITSFVYNSLGLTDDADRGILVVGLDLPSLAPAVGAGATIDRPSDASFVFAGVQAVFATDIPTNGQGFLTFPNVEPGPVNVTVSYPSGTCRIFPAETESVPVEITAGEVSVVAYTCRPE